MRKSLVIWIMVSAAIGLAQQRQVATAWYQDLPVTYEIVGGMAIVDGDIILGPAVAIPAHKPAEPRAVIVPGDTYRWPNGVIPYVIDPALPDPSRVTDAMALWNQVTVVKFVPRSGEADYLSVAGAAPGVCGSVVGRVGGAQPLSLAPGCGKEAILHELGHTIGFFHESQRMDRDNWLQLNFTEMAKTNWIGGHQVLSNAVDTGPFDYGSVMLYTTFSDSWRGKPTIEATPAGIPIWYLNYSFELSATIIETVRNWYQPTGDTVLATHPPGLDLVADGQRVTTPARFTWDAGSTHRIEAADPQSSGTTRHLFATWSDGGDRVHDYVVPAGGGVVVANFQRQYLITQTLGPPAGGTIKIDPPSRDGFYTEDSALTITAVPASGYQFETWYGDLQDWSAAGQGFGANPAVIRLHQPSPTIGAGFRLVTGVVSTFLTNPPGLNISIDGVSYKGPFRPNNWAVGSQHAVSAATQFGASNVVRWVFTGWSDGGSATRTVTAGIPNALYVANFRPQWQLTILSAGGGTVTATPPSAGGYYDDGAAVQLSASPSGGRVLSHWTYDLQGPGNPQTLIMDDQKMVGPVFASAPLQPSFSLTSPLNVYLAAIEGDRAGFNYPLFTGPIATDFTIAAVDPWLQLSATQGHTPASIILTADAASLSPGVYTSTLSIQIPGADDRTVSVSFTVTPRDLKTQPADTCRISVSPAAAAVAQSGGSGQIQVTAANASCPRAAYSNASWISLTGGASAPGSGTLSYTVQANPNSVPRAATITIGTKFVTVTQGPGAPAMLP